MDASPPGSAAVFRVLPAGQLDSAPADPERFLGAVQRTEVFSGSPEQLSGHVFSYDAGARSNWHVHEGEQALIVVRGHGRVQWRGAPSPVEVGEGDWIYVQPGVPHWHGAAPDSEFVHLAVTAGGATDWLGRVSETEYETQPE